MDPLIVDLSILADGPANVCVLGISSKGLISDYKDATLFSWIKDTSCGEMSGEGSSQTLF